MTIDLSWLRTWVQVVDSGGFARAADAMHLSQPRVSAHIANLERELGVNLIERRSRPLRLTPDGARLLPRARLILNAMGELVAEAWMLSGQVSRRLDIASFVSASSAFLPAIVEAFQAHHPYVDVEILDGDADQIGTALIEGRVALALRPMWPEPDDRSLTFQPLWSEEYVAVMPSSHALVRYSTIPAADLADIRVITIGDPLSSSLVGREAQRLLAAIRPRSVESQAGLVAHQPTTLAAMVRQGLGVGLVNRLAVSLIADDLTIRPIEGLALTRDVGVWWHAGRALDPTAAEFIEAVRNATVPPGTTKYRPPKGA